MRVITGNSYLVDKPIALAIGTFDGMHLGHRYLLDRLIEICKVNLCSSMIYTFGNHPLFTLDPQNAPPLLMSLEKKILEFSRVGVEYLIIRYFDIKFSEISPQNFISDLCQSYDIRYVVVGHDFSFGKKGIGNIHLLKELSLNRNFEVISVPPRKIDGQIVSSSLIRKYLNQGKVSEATTYLGYPYTLCGNVVRGFGRGTKIGFPTANLKYNNTMAIPGAGVYLTKGIIEKKEFWGATSVGNNPTFSQEGTHIETYFLNNNSNLYGKQLKLVFIEKLRDQIRFDTIEDLVRQIRNDIDQIKYLICKN